MPKAPQINLIRAICPIVLVAILLGLSWVELLPELDTVTLDAQQRLQIRFSQSSNSKASELLPRLNPVIVGMDDQFVDQVETPIALSHVWIAKLLEALASAKPAVIGVDFAFPVKRFDSIYLADNPQVNFHQRLIQGLANASRSVPIVAIKVWDSEKSDFSPIHPDFQNVLDSQPGEFEAVTSAMFCQDVDGMIRTLPDSVCQPDDTEHGLANEMAVAMGLPGVKAGWIDFSIGEKFDYIPMMDVIQASERGDKAWLSSRFEGRPVLFGAVMQNMDSHFSPHPLAAWLGDTTYVPGVLFHAQIFRSIVSERGIKALPDWIPIVLTLVTATLWWLPSQRLFELSVLVMMLSATVVQVLLIHRSLWLPLSLMWLCGASLVVLRLVFDNIVNLSEKRRLKKVFGGYVSPSVLDGILKGSIDGSGQGKEVEVAILFSDIRGFTRFGEKHSAEQVVQLLNDYFGRMTRVVHESGGTVDKFIGDGLMAFFGAPNSLLRPATQAACCALKMQNELESFNQTLEARGQQPIQIGIGLHFGWAVIGHIGSPDRFEYTAIGDTVNATARIESLSKDLGTSVLCSKAFAERMNQEDSIPVDKHFAEFPNLGNLKMTNFGPQALKGRADMAVFGMEMKR